MGFEAENMPLYTAAFIGRIGTKLSLRKSANSSRVGKTSQIGYRTGLTAIAREKGSIVGGRFDRCRSGRLDQMGTVSDYLLGKGAHCQSYNCNSGSKGPKDTIT